MQQVELIDEAIRIGGYKHVLQKLGINRHQLSSYRSEKHELKFSRVQALQNIIQKQTLFGKMSLNLKKRYGKDSDKIGYIRTEIVGNDNTKLFIFWNTATPNTLVGIYTGNSISDVRKQLNWAVKEYGAKFSICIQMLFYPEQHNPSKDPYYWKMMDSGVEFFDTEKIEEIIGESANFILQRAVPTHTETKYRNLLNIDVLNFYFSICQNIKKLPNLTARYNKEYPSNSFLNLDSFKKSLQPVYISFDKNENISFTGLTSDEEKEFRSPSKAQNYYFELTDNISYPFSGMSKILAGKNPQGKIFISFYDLYEPIVEKFLKKHNPHKQFFLDNEANDFKSFAFQMAGSIFSSQSDNYDWYEV